MTREPFIAHSELTNEIYIVVGKEKYRVTEQAIKAVMAIKALEQEDILDKIRAEIKNDWQLKKFPCSPFSCGLRQAIVIIDKYREEVHHKESEEEE
jgi:hypothetical protein